MKYMLIFQESTDALASRFDPDEAKSGAYWSAWGAYHQALEDSGAYTGSGNALQPADTATTVRIRNGERQVQDGPYADSKEQLGGYMIIETANLDDALQWAARCPAAAYGAVEVRPVLVMEKPC